MLIFDSYDCAGKTTLATLVAKRLGFIFPNSFTSRSVKFEDIEKHRFYFNTETQTLINVILSLKKLDLIIDRWIMTEYCYSPIMRNYYYTEYWDIENILKEYKVLWVYPSILNGDIATILSKRFKDKNEQVNINKIITIKESFDYLFFKSKLSKILIDTSSDNQEIINANVEKIVNYYENM